MTQESSLGSGKGKFPHFMSHFSDLGVSGSSKYHPELYRPLHPPPKQRRGRKYHYGRIAVCLYILPLLGVGGGAATWKPIHPFCFSGFKGHGLDIVILSEASQTEKDKHHMILLICGI